MGGHCNAPSREADFLSNDSPATTDDPLMVNVSTSPLIACGNLPFVVMTLSLGAKTQSWAITLRGGIGVGG
jgi:hypothetical protein